MKNKKPAIYTIATAHLDTSWLWTFEKSVSEYIPDTLSRNFRFLDKYPLYKFNFEGSYRYELVKEYYPEEYEKLKKYIAQGRWNPCGACYENGDVNIPSPEALTRNILYGNGFFRKEFGVESNDIFLPDCFGFGKSLPSVAAHSGLTGFSTGKLLWGSSVDVPFDIGKWNGADGRGVWAAIMPFAYTTAFPEMTKAKRVLEKLEKAKIKAIGDLANTEVARVQRIVGIKMGQQIHDYANGIDPSPVLAAPEEAKGYSISTTLEEDVTKSEQAYKVLLALSDSVTARIRADGAKAFCVAVSIRSNDFKTHSHQRSLMDPTDISKEVYQISKQLFDELWDSRTPLRLIGISMTNITREETAQMSLFPDENWDKARKLDKAYDAINSKFGSATIVRGSSMKSNLNVGKKFQAQIEQKKK